MPRKLGIEGSACHKQMLAAIAVVQCFQDSLHVGDVLRADRVTYFNKAYTGTLN